MRCPVCSADVEKIWSNGYGCEECTRECTLDELNAELFAALRKIEKLSKALNKIAYGTVDDLRKPWQIARSALSE